MLWLNTIRCRNNIPRSAIPDPITARIKFTLDCSPPTRTLVAVSSNPYQPARPKGIQPGEENCLTPLCAWILSLSHSLSTWRTPQFSGSITTVLAKGRGQLKKTFSFGHCPNYLTPPPWPQFGQLGPLFSEVEIQDLKVSLELRILYIYFIIHCIYAT